MSKPIERIYVIENNLDGPQQASGFDVNPARAERFAKDIGGHVRVFTEEKPWHPASEPPSHGRPVFVLFFPGDREGPMVRQAVALFGSESKWVAIDHAQRRTYHFSEGSVFRWRELPDMPEEY
jgi:hypothetical protein